MILAATLLAAFATFCMYLAVVADTTPRIVSATRVNEDRARLSPDGRWGAFQTSPAHSRSWYRPSPTFTVVSRVPSVDDIFIRAFAPHASYDVSPNGSQFIFLKEVVDPKLFVAHNWFAELRAARAGQR